MSVNESGALASSIVPATAEAFGLLFGKRVAILYEDKRGLATHRTIVPIAITSVYGHTAVRATCLLRNDERTFLLRRIRSAMAAEWPAIHAENLRQRREKTQLRLREAKKVFAVVLLLLTISESGCLWAGSQLTSASVGVSGYYRRDGTYVSSYHRRPAGSVSRDTPYELLRVLCFFIVAGSGLGAWASWESMKTQRRELESLARREEKARRE